MHQGLKIYLAGPEVFLPEAAEIGRRKKSLCRDHGFEGLSPFDNNIPADGAQPADRLIYAANVAMMRAADIGIFNLTPFRGPSADAGTVFELGLMAGLGKAIYGYSNAATELIARITDATLDAGTDVWRDRDGLLIENFGNADNLMIVNVLAERGGGLVRVDGEGRLDDLRGFEMCLRLASERLRERVGQGLS